METWRIIPAYGFHYEASNLGRVRSLDREVTKYSALCNKVVIQKYKGRLLRGTLAGGYINYSLTENKKNSYVQAGRLILLAFIGKPKEGQECCHNDGDSLNNKIENLRWDSHLENNRDRVRHKTYKTGEDHHFCKFSNELRRKIKVKEISKKEAIEAGVSNTHYYRILRS